MNNGKLEHILELLGAAAFLVPCESGTKVPACGYVDRSFEETKSPAYCELLDQSNVAVYLGKASGGLVALDFDRDEDLYAWAAMNAPLASSLRSRGARGAQVWFKIKGDFPKSCQCNHYEFRADKRLSTILGVHPSGVDYQLLVDAPPMEIEFSAIKWPEGWPIPGDDERENLIEAEYGSPWEQTKSGIVKLNQGFHAARFMSEADVLWDSETGRFYEYDPATGLWLTKPEEEITHRAGACVRAMLNEVAANAGSEFSSRVRRGHALNNYQFQNGIMKSLKGEALSKGKFSTHLGIVHTLNGMVDLNDSPYTFKPFAKEFYSRNQVPLKFDAEAKCPRFVEFLASQLDTDDQHMLQLWCGHALLQENLLQVFLVLTGTPGGGKGTLARIIRLAVGERNICELRTRHLQSRFEMGLMAGKTLLFGSDVEPDFLSNEGAPKLKSMTGGDLLTGEVKGGMDSHTMTGKFNMLVTCNTRLLFRLSGDAGAWGRRMLWLPFEQPPPEHPTPHLERILIEAEGSGILNWMVAGAVEILQCAKENTRFPQTKAQRERVQSLISESDSVREFLRAKVRRSTFPTDHITADGLFRSYLTFCESRGWAPLAQRTFALRSEDIVTAEYRAHKDNHLGDTRNKRGWVGVTLGEEVNEETEPY